jgi:hypothetical protein
MCWLGDFALDHANSIPEVQGAFIRNNPNRMTLSEQRQPERGLAARERVQSAHRQSADEESVLILTVGFVKRRDG